MVPSLRMHRAQPGEARETPARQLKAPEQRCSVHGTVVQVARDGRDGRGRHAPCDRHHAAAIGGLCKVAVKGLRGAANRVDVVRGGEVVHAARQQRFRQVELEGCHLAAEPEPVKVVAGPMLLIFLQARTCQHTRCRAAVSWELALKDEVLETDGILGFHFGGRHGLSVALKFAVEVGRPSWPVRAFVVSSLEPAAIYFQSFPP